MRNLPKTFGLTTPSMKIIIFLNSLGQILKYSSSRTRSQDIRQCTGHYSTGIKRCGTCPRHCDSGLVDHVKCKNFKMNCSKKCSFHDSIQFGQCELQVNFDTL